MRNIGLFLILFFLFACTPTTKVTLIPDENGKTGSVVVKSKTKTVELNKPYTFVSVDTDDAPIEVKKVDHKIIIEDSKELFQAEPEKTMHFTLYFQYDSTILTSASREMLPVIFKQLRDRKFSEINIIGHTDTKGTQKHNISLSLKRARVVHQLLKQLEGNLPKTYVQSFGEKDLLVPTADDVAEPRNRRVEVMIR